MLKPTPRVRMSSLSALAVLADLAVDLERELGGEDAFGPAPPEERRRWRKARLDQLKYDLARLFPDQVDDALTNAYWRTQ